MKIAAVTNDGKSISQHFGRSRYYRIVSIEDGEIKNSEIRERGTGHFAQQQQHESHTNHFDAQGRHGFGAEAQNRHSMMAQEIADCDVLIAGGMGAGAYQSFVGAGLNVVLTDQTNIDEAVSKFSKGELKNLYMDRTD
ncbi:dinitrogenase iron-molybdenum cofactor [bacterium BMS3Abin04]|nr:dinitrogenase iron-molybdenum cofactor [bacterium BMS3Abin04]